MWRGRCSNHRCDVQRRRLIHAWSCSHGLINSSMSRRWSCTGSRGFRTSGCGRIPCRNNRRSCSDTSHDHPCANPDTAGTRLGKHRRRHIRLHHRFRRGKRHNRAIWRHDGSHTPDIALLQRRKYLAEPQQRETDTNRDHATRKRDDPTQCHGRTAFGHDNIKSHQQRDGSANHEQSTANNHQQRHEKPLLNHKNSFLLTNEPYFAPSCESATIH